VSARIVVDASVSASWFLPDEMSDAAERLLELIVGGEARLIEPSLWLYESINILKSAVVRKRITQTDARKALYFLKEIPTDYVSPENIGEQLILEHAISNGLSAYDATYLTLAESCGADLFTADGDLLRLAPRYSFIKDIRKSAP